MVISKKHEESNDPVDQAAQSAGEAIKSTQRVANEALESLSASVEEVRAGALRASDGTANYIKQEPIKAILIAAVVGAALMALVNLMGRSRDS